MDWNPSVSTVCPDHGVDVKKKGYEIDEGWARCPVNPNDPVTGDCLFTRPLN